jgi:arylformamidase
MKTMHATDIETQFNPRRAVPDVETHALRMSQLSAAVRQRRKGLWDVRYGTGPLATLDVFPAEQDHAPLHVFLHGGYWRGRDKSDFSFLADALNPLGICLVVMNYDLCPQVELPAIVDQVDEGLAWIHRHATQWGADPHRCTASGHSAGAHLLATVLARHAHDKVPSTHLPRSALLISGVYDLEPVLSISVNQEIRLRAEQVESMSPISHIPCTAVPLDVAVGGAETAGFVGQSKAYAQHCLDHGVACQYHELSGLNHYTVLQEFESPQGALSQRVAQRAL